MNTFKKKSKQCLWLFGVNLFISTFTFGGGYVVIPMIRKFFVQKKKLFSEEELMELAAIAQSSPGAIAVNLSALAGYRTAGTAGVLVCSTAAVLPPLIILSAVSHWYSAFAGNSYFIALLQGMQAAVAAILADLIADMTKTVLQERSVLYTLMIPGTFLASCVFSLNVAFILLTCCLLCVLRIFWKQKRRGKR